MMEYADVSPKSIRLQDVDDDALRWRIVHQSPDWQDAFEELILVRYHRVLRAIANRFKRSLELESWMDLIEPLLTDLVGTGKPWHPLETWDPQRPFGTWLFSVTLHLCLRLVRRQRGGFPNGSIIPIDEPYHDQDNHAGTWEERIRADGDPVDVLLEWGELVEALIRALLQLDDLYQETVIWSFFDELTDEAIAKRHGCTRETANRRKARALTQMREALQGGQPAAYVAQRKG